MANTIARAFKLFSNETGQVQSMIKDRPLGNAPLYLVSWESKTHATVARTSDEVEIRDIAENYA